MSTKNNVRISRAVPQVKSCMQHVVSLGLIASTLCLSNSSSFFFPTPHSYCSGMSSSQALALQVWTPPLTPPATDGTVMVQENSRPEGGGWALFVNAFLSPSPGRTLNQVYTAAGRVLEPKANRFAHKFGLEPHAVTGKIKSHFGDAEQRVQQLELLQTTVSPKLKKWCLKLMKYTLLRGPIEASEAPFDYDGVDFLAATLLNGLSNWFSKLDQKDWAMQPWYQSFTQVLQLLREPQAAELLPCSSASATSTFEDVLPIIYQDRVLNVDVRVDNQNTVPGDRATPAANHSTDNLSAHSINSDHDVNQESSEQGIEPLDDSQSQTSNLDSGELPLHDEESTGSEDLDFSEADDTVSDIIGYEQQFGMASEHGDVLEDSINGATGIPRISRTQSILASTPYLSPETQRKDLEEWKLILLNRKRDLEYGSARDLRVTVLEKYQILGEGENPSALQVMHSLGFKEAQEVMELTLEKQRKVLGENHPQTTRSLGFLAVACQDLGQINKAQELAMSAVEIYTQLLGEDHPDTVWSMYTLANIYDGLGQFTEAEDLYHIVVEKSISIFGENHPETLQAMTGLGITYLASDQLKKAEGLLTVVFDKQKRVLGEEHPETLETMGYLASTYNYLGQLSVAEELEILALEKHQKVCSENHPSTLWIMFELALIFQQQGRLEHAEELLIIALEKRRKKFGLANLYRRMGELQAAQELERLIGGQAV
ncbi:hypothetical protein B0H14DRAFT_2779166 [Mycena olivaceomarginata]|nr:hypothetical protein B0H14DRAFT_2779166 [Mycena olivaceomarginata]